MEALGQHNLSPWRMNIKVKLLTVYIETGQKKTFAGALDWPGWSRSGKDEQAALQALLDYGPRYAHVLQRQGIDVPLPENLSGVQVEERHPGSATTDFGAPAAVPAADLVLVGAADVPRLQKILAACWQDFDSSQHLAAGRQLNTGPRGGGRSLEKITAHVIEADQAYLAKLAWKSRPVDLSSLRQAMLDALEAAAQGTLPKEGPRGGTVWPVRYFVRRVAWHTLDHAWEIEDRLV